VLFHSTIKAYLFNPLTVALALIGGGHPDSLHRAQGLPSPRPTIEEMNWRDALKVGFAQAVAMFPGVSRSGATIMGGLIFGLSRKTATEFSFFLAIPTMFAATAYDVYKNWKLLHMPTCRCLPSVSSPPSFPPCCASRRCCAISSHDFTVFAWYRIVFGIVVLLTAQFGWVQWAAN
jgi:undecaprenyl-diphosphatase